jgi:hypothetical protein
MVFKKISDLNEDQKMLITGIYDEFALSFTELRDEMRAKRNYEEMRTKMAALREEKNELIGDVLNKSQYEIYATLIEVNDKQRRERQSPPSENGNSQ